MTAINGRSERWCRRPVLDWRLSVPRCLRAPADEFCGHCDCALNGTVDSESRSVWGGTPGWLPEDATGDVYPKSAERLPPFFSTNRWRARRRVRQMVHGVGRTHGVLRPLSSETVALAQGRFRYCPLVRSAKGRGRQAVQNSNKTPGTLYRRSHSLPEGDFSSRRRRIAPPVN